MSEQRMRILQHCPTTWSNGGWRAWRDRFLFGHVGHTCDLVEHDGGHTCRCGARIPSPFREDLI